MSRDSLQLVVERLAGALHAGDLDVARALAAPDAWQAPDHSPSALALRMVRARPRVAVGEMRVRDDRAAVRFGFLYEGGEGDAWMVFHEDPALGWQWVAATVRWEPAGLYVTGLADAVPVWSGLPADTAAARWGKAVVEAIRAGNGPTGGVPPEAWEALAGPVPEGHEVHLGEVRVLLPVNRAAVEIAVFAPDRPDAPDSRYAVLERLDPDSPWTFREVGFGRALSSLLDGVEVGWDAPSAEATEEGPLGDEDPLGEALRARIFQVLREQGIDPDAFEDLSELPVEQLEQLLPKLVGGAFQALLGTLLGRLKESLDEADARDPAVMVDLDQERAKRAGGPSPEPPPLDDDVAREVRGALREALRAATDDHGEPRLDADFAQTEGPQILGSLFEAVARALAPTEVTVDVGPEPGHESEGPTKMTLPIGELLGSLFAEAARRPAGESDDGEE